MFARFQKLLASLGKNLGRPWVLVFLVVAVGLVAGGLIRWTLFEGPGELAYRFVPGERWRHQLRYAGSGIMDMNAVTAGQNAAVGGEQVQAIQRVVVGELVMDVLEKDERRIVVAYSFAKAEVVLTIGGQPLVETAAMIAADLAEPVFAEMDLQGRIQSLRFAPEINDISRHSVRSLLAATQLVLPGERDASDVWEAWEEAPMGRCRAVYQTDPDSPWGTIGLVKTREEYERPTAKKRVAGPQTATTLHPDGALRITFDPDLGQVHTIKGSETLVMKVGGKVLSASESSISLEFLNKESLPVAELGRLCRLGRNRAQSIAAESLVATFSSQRGRLLGQKQELGDATLESLQADLASAESNPEQKKDQTPLYLKIKALIAVYPETSSRWGELVSLAEPKSLTMRLVPGALGTIGHDQAQAALVAALKARANDKAVVERLMVILAQVETPSPLAENTLRDLALRSSQPSIAGQAQLSLGTMARNLAETSPERAAKTVAWAVSDLEAATSESKVCQMLLVLGNAGAVEALPAIRRRLDDKAIEVRAAAVSALRFIDTDQAEALLIQALTADPEAEVRRAAVAAFRYRFVSNRAIQANREALRSDKSPAVRLVALNLLWQVRQRFPEVIALVENAAADDLATEVRKAACRLLEKPTNQ
jgi:hypothetical protein